jgi:hypothetical protein
MHRINGHAPGWDRRSRGRGGLQTQGWSSTAGWLSGANALGEGQSEPIELQHYLQQPRAFRLRLGFGCASASLRGLNFASINH